jgi:transposase
VFHKRRLEQLLADLYRQSPSHNLLASITGVGEVTAKIVDIQRFDSPKRLVG